MADRIDLYVGALAALLGPQLADRERLLAEVEDHLRSAVDAAVAEGLDPSTAVARAIERFGSPQAVASALLDGLRQPLVFDARQGLPAAALDELRQATRIALAARGRDEAVLGYWVPSGLHERFGALRLRMRHRRPQLPACEQPIVHAVVQHHGWWHTQLLSHVQPGMSLHVEVWDGELRLWYGPFPDAPRPSDHFRYVAFRLHDRPGRTPLQQLIVR